MINTIKVTFFVVLGLMISACTSSPDDTVPATINTPLATSDKNSLENIEQQLSEWQEMKPSLERLVLIEDELKSIIKEISKMAAEQKRLLTAKETKLQSPVMNQASAQQSVTTPEPVLLTEPEILGAKKSEPSEIPEVVSEVNTEQSYSKFALQVFTLRNELILEKSWKKWSEKHKETLAEHHPIYQEIKKDKMSYFRVKITNFITKEDAISTCQKIKLQGDDCFLVGTTGQRFLE